ncbi:MAG: glycosyltransferase family 2 protein [Lachnospiraceae bacterium]|nr:glycosyltransferase family 2 protein [Lachnospiraceae bacterium]
MEKKRNELLIIIPAYNEVKTIGKLLDSMEEAGITQWADILVMNDASKDGTGKLVRARGYRVVTHIFNLGYGSGLQLGYKYAARNFYKYVIQMDADGQHDISNITTLYDALKKEDEKGNTPDIVLGSRFVEGATEFKIGFAKKIAIKLFKFLIRLFGHKKVTDPTTGLQGLSRRAFYFYSQFNHFDDRYPDANMILQMQLLGYNIVEVPAVMHVRTEGTSMHSGLKPILYMIRMMYSIIAVWVRIRLFHSDSEGAVYDKVAADSK